MSALIVFLVLGVGPGGVLGLGSCVCFSFCVMCLAFVFVSAFVFADLMALLCCFCGSVIALRWFCAWFCNFSFCDDLSHL